MSGAPLTDTSAQTTAASMFQAFLHAYAQGRAAAQQAGAQMAAGLFPDIAGARPAPQVPSSSGATPMTLDLEDLIGALPSDDAFHHAAKVGHVLTTFAHGLRDHTPDERRRILDHCAGDLEALGLSRRQIEGFDPSDRNLAKLLSRLKPLVEAHAQAHPGHFTRP